MSRTTERMGTKSRNLPNGRRITKWFGHPYGRANKRARAKR